MSDTNATDYYELYRYHGLPLAEAYYLAEYKYFISRSNSVLLMVIALLKEICWQKHITSFTEEECLALCKRYMKEQGYLSYYLPCIFVPVCNYFNNPDRPDNLKIRNTTNYLELYEKKLLSIEETYVLAKNKNLLLCDDQMPEMIIKIETVLLEKMVGMSGSQIVTDVIQECLRQNPRKQIVGFDLPIGYLMEYYMQHYGYTYDSVSQNGFVPVGVKKMSSASGLRNINI